MPLAALARIGIPLALAISGLLAWRIARRDGGFDAPEKPAWRDDSLDDWRRERDARMEEERLHRQSQLHEGERTGKEEVQETQRQQHTRLGG